MSLIIYINEEDIPRDTKVCMFNDRYFNGNTLLSGSEDCKAALWAIDKAVYNSESTFIGRNPSIGALYREYLSTGCKTVINIIQHPDICFTARECGQNAKEFILTLTEGQVLWSYGQLDIDDDISCDVVCNNIHFNNIGELITYMDGEM